MQMSDSEIRRRHKEGTTVQILADLNAVPSSTIKSILENKPIPATPKKKYEHRSAEYKKLYDEGKGDSEIGELMGTRARNVWSWRKTNKLPSNVAPKRKKEKKVDTVAENAFIFAMENAEISMDVEEDIPKVTIEPNDVLFGNELFVDLDAPNPVIENKTLEPSQIPYELYIDLSMGNDYHVISEWDIKDGVRVLKSCTITKT